MAPGAMLHKLSRDPLPTCQTDFRSYVGGFVLDSMWFRVFQNWGFVEEMMPHSLG